jgi:hypothetical protein
MEGIMEEEDSIRVQEAMGVVALPTTVLHLDHLLPNILPHLPTTMPPPLPPKGTTEPHNNNNPLLNRATMQPHNKTMERLAKGTKGSSSSRIIKATHKGDRANKGTLRMEGSSKEDTKREEVTKEGIMMERMMITRAPQCHTTLHTL